MKCKKGYEIQCMKSLLGSYYLGTRDNDGSPNCRISEYFDNEVPINIAYMNRMDAMSIQFCNGFSNCMAGQPGNSDGSDSDDEPGFDFDTWLENEDMSLRRRVFA